MHDSYRVAGCQFAPTFLDLGANLNKIESMVQIARQEGQDVKLAVFAELATTGMVVFPAQRTDYRYRDAFHDVAETADGPAMNRLKAMARANSMFIVTGFLEADPVMTGVSYNSAVLISDHGEVLAVHRKCHISPSELTYFRAGAHPTVVTTPLGKIGLSICYDFWFPEFIRHQAVRLGCEVHVNVTANVKDFTLGSTHFPIVRAAENSMYVISVNRVGTDQPSGYEFVGHSSIVSPYGEVIASAPAGREAVIYGDVDVNNVKRARTRIPVLKDFKTWEETKVVA